MDIDFPKKRNQNEDEICGGCAGTSLCVSRHGSTVCRSFTPGSGVAELEGGATQDPKDRDPARSERVCRVLAGRTCVTCARSRGLGEPETPKPERLQPHQRWWHGGYPAVYGPDMLRCQGG